MNDPQGGNPPGPPPAGAYGPGHTVLGEPAFPDMAPQGAFPLPQGGAPPGPMAGAPVPATIVDTSGSYGAPVPPSPYGAPPSPYGAPPSPYGAPPPAYGANPYAAAPAPNPYAPIPQAPPRRGGGGASQGPSLVIIGVAAFAVIGAVVTFVALRSRASSAESDKPIPTIDVPPVATVPSDPGVTDGGEPPPPDPAAAADPPATPPPVVTAPSKPVPTAPKPTSTVPPPRPSGSSQPPPVPSGHPTPIPTTSTKPVPSTPTPSKGPFLGPRKKK